MRRAHVGRVCRRQREAGRHPAWVNEPDNLQITFRGMESSSAVQAWVTERVGKIQRLNPHVMSWHVTIGAHPRSPAGHQAFDVHAQARVPGRQVSAHVESASSAYKGLARTFAAVRRSLTEHGHRRAPGI